MSEDEEGNISDNLIVKPTIVPQSPHPYPLQAVLCIVWELGEGEENEVWIECTWYYRWVHESCLLANYQFSPQDTSSALTATDTIQEQSENSSSMLNYH